jgi:hypothetical protein
MGLQSKQYTRDLTTTIVSRQYVGPVCVRTGITMKVGNELGQEASLYNVNEKRS